MINILNKRSSTQGHTPALSSLELGELAINTYEGKLFLKKDDGSPMIVEVGKKPAWIVTSANYTALKDDKILSDTSSAAFTVTLPASPATGDEIIILDQYGTWSINNLTIDPNGKNIFGNTDDLLCDVADSKITLVYTNPTNGWRVYIDTSNENNDNDEWILKTTNYTADVNDKIMADTASAGFTITLPLSPSVGFEVNIIDYRGTWDTNNLSVNGNSSNIDGSASNGVYSLESSKITFIYTDSTIGWKTYIDSDDIDGGTF